MLAVLAGAIFMLLLDTTIVNVAQVKIREGLNADLSEIQWILDSYLLAFAVLLLTFGRLGDVFGRKRLFILGMSDLRCRVRHYAPHPVGSVTSPASVAQTH